jgi:ubiquitin C-terminal hydrolase
MKIHQRNDDLNTKTPKAIYTNQIELQRGLKGGKKGDEYGKLSEISSEKHSMRGTLGRESLELKQAISNSMESNVKPKFKDKRDKTVIRKENDQFIGMANLGNTCYFNSMMQILYFSDCFAQKICEYNAKIELLKELDAKSDSTLTEDQKQKKIMKKKFLQNGVRLIEEIQEMFGKMLFGKINYANPQGVLDHLMEKMTNRKVEVGLQKDLVEFLGLFFECLEAGFSLDQKVSFELIKDFQKSKTNQYFHRKTGF